nr:hypothetical protein [Anaeromyxobacter sp. Fw109-5]
MVSSSVIIDELDLRRLARLELEHDAELVVHPDAVEAGQAPFQLLESVSGRDRKIPNVCGRPDEVELSPGDGAHVGAEAPRRP